MKRKLNLMSLILSAVAVVCFISSPAFSAQTFKLAHCVNPDPNGPYQATSLKFKELVEKGTSGRVNVKIFPQRQLGDDRAILEGVRDGIIEVGLVTVGPIGAFDPRVDLIELPFLFKSKEHIKATLEGAIGKDLLNMSKESGLLGLAYSIDGISNITNSKRPLKTADDFKGLDMRVIESPIRIAVMKALGANPIPIAYGELYTALKTGVVYGQSNANWVISARSLYEVQKYISITQHIVSPTILLTNSNALAKLSKKDQEILRSAAMEAGRHGFNVYYKSEEEHLNKAIEHGMIVTRDPDLDSMMKATASVYEKVYKKHPQWRPIVKSIRDLGKQY